MNMKFSGLIITTVFTVLILFGSLTMNAQTQDAPSNDEKLGEIDRGPDTSGGIEWDKVYVGGRIGGGIAGGINVDVSPDIGYFVREDLLIAAGPSFRYVKYDPAFYRSLGGHVFARYFPIRNLYVHAEYEAQSYKSDFFAGQGELDNSIYNGLYLGGGYNFAGPGRSYANATILYNFLDSDRVINPNTGIFGDNPIIRIGGGIRL